MMKRIVFGVMFLLTASLLVPQSLTDASKQERERREKLKGKAVKVITNADLKSKPKASGGAASPQEAAKPKTEGQTEPAPEAGEAAEAEAQQAPLGEEPTELPPGYATSADPESFLVENPGFAVGSPDGRYAEISISGVLDLDVLVNNEAGEDLAVYAKPPAKLIPKDEEEGQFDTDQTSMWWGNFGYAVLGLDSRGEWQEIGIGSGKNPDKFDLGALKSTRKIRIMFKTYSNPYNEGPKPFRASGQELTFGVDAVGAIRH